MFGIDVLLDDEAKLNRLRSARVGLVAHPASINSANTHSIDALMDAGCRIVRALAPNMVCGVTSKTTCYQQYINKRISKLAFICED